MMALIGFFAVLALGVVLIMVALAGAAVSSKFSGKIEWPHFLLLGGSGAALVWFAVKHCPFTLTLS